MRALLSLVLVLTACAKHGGENPPPWLKTEASINCWNGTHYVKEPEAGLCFLQVGCPGYRGFSLTSVTCTPEVEALINKP